MIQGSKKFLSLLCSRPETIQHHFHCILFFKAEHSASQDLSEGGINSTFWWEEQHVYTGIGGMLTAIFVGGTIAVLPLVDSSHLSQHAVHTPKMPRNLIQLWPQVQSPLSYDLHVDEAAGLQLFWFGYLLTKKTSYSPHVPIHLIYNFETGTADTAIRE